MSGHTVWASSRLLYVHPEEHHDTFLQELSTDATGWTQANPMLATPHTAKKHGVEQRDWMEKALLGVIVCLPAPAAEEQPAADASKPADGKAPEKPKPIPIGQLTLDPLMKGAWQHRNAMIGIGFLPNYQGHGYGSEAIRWALWWAFRYANLHRVDIGGFEWNPRALGLYERIGFKPEARKREALWFNGRYWDLIELAMLKREWEELYGESDGIRLRVTDVNKEP